MVNDPLRNPSDPGLDGFALALRMLETQEEFVAFLTDMLSAEDITRLSKRWRIISLLLDNRSHREIRDLTGASLYMISRANRTVIKTGTGMAPIVWRRCQARRGDP